MLALTVAAAVEMPKPTVAYRATQVMISGGNRVEMPIYHKPGKTRMENTTQGQTIVLIRREDLGVLWTLLPGNIYSESQLTDEGGLPGPTDVDLTELVEEGEETVGDVVTTRYRFAHQAGDGTSNQGKVWLTPENIVVKSVVTGQGNGQSFDITIENQDIYIGDQPDALFELPEGAQLLPDFPGQASLPGGAIDDIPDPGEASNEEIRQKTGESLGEAYDEVFGTD